MTFVRGQKAWNKGLPAPWAKNNAKNLPSVPWNKGKDFLQDEIHPKWKGEKVGYRALHYWVEGKLGKPDTCEHCGKIGLQGHQIQWANISRKYKRDLNDWLRLCVKCHKNYDKTRDIVSV